jgi:hypothetical protein
MVPYRTYLQVAFTAILCSLSCFIMKMSRFPGDTIVVRSPDTTMHDLVYFNSEHFVNLFGLVACYNLCTWAERLYPISSIVHNLRTIMLTIMLVCVVRTIAHFITYYEVTTFELVIDAIIIVYCIISLIIYNLKHRRDAADTGTTAIHH